MTQADFPLDGEVFIVTRAAENIRLGQLDVRLVRRSDFDRIRITDYASAEQQRLARDFAAAKKAGDEDERLITEIKTNYATLVEDRDTLVRQLPSVRRLHENYRRLMAEIAKRDEALDHDSRALSQLPDDSYRACRHVISATQELPHAIAVHAATALQAKAQSCKTDAEGHFHFMCPKGDYVIFTSAHRETPKQIEVYEWFVSAEPSADSHKRTLLSNRNTIESASSDNLLAGLEAGLQESDFSVRSLSRGK